MKTEPRPVIAVTMGDAAGVGPELCLRAISDARVLDACIPVIFGHAGVLARVAATCGLPPPPDGMPLAAWEMAPPSVTAPLVVNCGDIDAASVRPGTIDARCGRLAFDAVTAAVRTVQAGRAAAMATAPLHKGSMHLAGVPYPGHTELLAALTNSPRVCMMLASDVLSVSLATIHVALADAPGLLTIDGIRTAIELTYAAMQRLGKRRPRIAVCGLNPHGGEGGLFGAEEQTLIIPAIDAAEANGYPATGPLVPDTAFLPERRMAFDAYVVMYHDQGLIPFKMLAFDRGVNVTLGLPIVRTSVDHGTAFDIA
jgi:4-hydroxythreonine-4-phosphate dehydrogenase